MKTELLDRTLWFDGDITIKPNSVYDFIEVVGPKNVGKIKVSELTPDIEQYNSLTSPQERIHTKHDVSIPSKKWQIPEHYRTLNVFAYVRDILDRQAKENHYTEEEYLTRLERMIIEYKEFKRLKLINLIRTLIFIINTFEREGVVWGPGRGSSVSSYLLYLIGVHDVDSVTYEIDISDFMKHI